MDVLETFSEGNHELSIIKGDIHHDISVKTNLNCDNTIEEGVAPEDHQESLSKPRIILKLRTSETDPEAYFSTSNLQVNNGREKISSKSPSEQVTPLENIFCKRNLRRISNSKESVLQNAIALKEKSFGLPECIVTKKGKSPKYTAEKRPVKLKSPRMASLHTPDKETVLNPFNTEYNKDGLAIDCVDLDIINGLEEKRINESSSSSLKSETNGICNGSATADTTSYLKPFRRKKRQRYFKGLSYSFGSGKNLKRKKLMERCLNHKYPHYSSSEHDTDSQNTLITSEEMSEPGVGSFFYVDSKSFEMSTESSLPSSVLIQSATDMKENLKHTSLEVINNEFNEKPPSPSVGDLPENPARPESTMVSFDNTKPRLCLCEVQEKVYMKVDNGTKYHCQAVDWIEGKHVGCCNQVTSFEEGDIKLQRPSVKVTYLMFCDVHTHRLLIHNCCPTCGIFCTQGSFVVCQSLHVYHRKCEVVVDEKRICPHCGIPSPSSDISISIGHDKNPVFLPLQNTTPRLEPCAKMTFHGNAYIKAENSLVTSIVPSRSYVLPCGKKITSEGIPLSIEKDKLEKYLSSGFRIFSNSPQIRHPYRTLYHAAKSGDLEKLLNCLVYGLNPNHKYRELPMRTALHAASANGFLTLVHVLRQAGSQLDELDKDQNTALMLAAVNKHNEVVKYLLKAGADVTIKGKDGMTVVHLAAKAGNLEACHYLLTNLRAPTQFINRIDDGGWTPLVWSAENNHLDVLLFLLANGADPLIRDNEQNVALHWAAFAGGVDACEVLLRYNSDIDSTNVHGDTPLHICARQEHYPCVLVLLAQGARTDIRNATGSLALDCCVNKPCDAYNAIKLNMQLKEITARGREKTLKILTNDMTRGNEINPIQCVNAVDDEPEPTDFVYITENCFTSHIKVNRTITSLKSCHCTDSCSTSPCTCSKLSLQCWYTDDGKLCPDFNFSDPPMIFECNPMCSCNKITCNNRVVQHGLTARFQLFRTKDKGWGVISLREIPKGSYVCEYIGEIISDTEADTRGEDSYLFDLDHKDNETYCIDAFRYGNFARFINHSCIPNLQPVKIFVNHQDLHFPRIAFFSNRDIKPYEELGFDYGEKFWIIKYKSFTCTCGSESCRYSRATIQKTLQAYNKKLQMEDASISEQRN